MMENLKARLPGAGHWTKPDLVGSAACALTFTLWNAAAQGALTPGVPLFFALFCPACLVAGRQCARILGEEAPRDFPTAFLLGFLVLNSALFVLVRATPLPIVMASLVLLAGVVAARLFWPAPGHAGGEVPGLATPGLLALGLCLAAATLWSWDSILAQSFSRRGFALKPWIDGHFHATQIRMFRDATGFASPHDPRMSDRPMWFYHHASYLVPALVSAATPTSAYLAFASFQVPFGVVLSGLAAFALVRSLWGGGAGVAATATLLLLPDATWHGLENPVLGYHWLQQVAPAGMYGVAVLAAAWMLMFQGCRAGRLSLVALGLLAAGMSVHYKAHMFVANALLIWLYPGVFLRGVPRRWKAAWLAFALAAFAVAVGLSQRVEGIPTLRLDGSSLKEYLDHTVENLAHGPTRLLFSRLTSTSSPPHDAFWGGVMIFYSSLGLPGVAGIALALVVLIRRVLGAPRRVALEHAAFPLLIALNYLVMSLGLAFDRRGSGHPDELLHRPLVWAYFVSAAWAGGLLYRLFLEDHARRSPEVRRALAAGAALLLVVPYALGPNVQVGPFWGRMLTNQVYPRGLFECARYIQVNADPGDIVQDSKNDPKLTLSAICERPAYAVAYSEDKPPPDLSRRLEEMRAFTDLTDAAAIRRFAARRRIRWYVLWPETRVKWPSCILDQPAFCWNRFRVFAFEPAARSGGKHSGPR